MRAGPAPFFDFFLNFDWSLNLYGRGVTAARHACFWFGGCVAARFLVLCFEFYGAGLGDVRHMGLPEGELVFWELHGCRQDWTYAATVWLDLAFWFLGV